MDTPQNNKGQNTSNEMSSETIITNIISNYQHLERSIVEQLALSNKLHGPTTGTIREDIWLQLFDMIIPKKFVIEHSVFIIDSFGRVSGEVDLAIVDNMYTPYIFQYGRLKFIPIEAVAAVVECKSTAPKYDILEKWHKDIAALRTSRKSIVRMATGMIIEGNSNGSPGTSTQTSTRPIRIFCGYDTSCSLDKLQKKFDFVLIAHLNDNGDKNIDVFVTPPNKQKTNNLKAWYESLNHNDEHYKEQIKDCPELDNFCLENLCIASEKTKVSLLTFNFQLNQLLMLINNPILFPHLSYAQLFNGNRKKDDQNHG